MNERARRIAVLVAAHVVFAAAAALMIRPAAAFWEKSWLDGAFRLRGGRATKARVVIAGIDDKSLAELGSWPWPRRRSAELIDRLSAAGAKTIAFDVMFAEPRGADDDRALVDATRRSGRVLHAYALSDDGLTKPLPGLTEASAGLGTVHLQDGPYGTRCLFPFSIEEEAKPMLAVAAAARDMGLSPAELRPRLDRMLCLNFRGARPYTTFSAADILNNRLPDELRLKLKDATVFVGFTSDAVAYDQWASPFDPKAPGIEMHATMFDNIVSGDPLRRINPIPALLVVYLAALAAALPFLRSPRTGAVAGGLVALMAIIAGPIGVHRIVGPYAAAAAAAAASYLACLSLSRSSRR